MIETGTFVWYDLNTTVREAAIDFYGAIAGWGTKPSGEEETPYTEWSIGDESIGGVMELSEEAREQGASPHWMAYVYTPDVDATAGRAVELGAELVVAPTDIEQVGRFAIFVDPQGAVIAPFAFESDEEMEFPERDTHGAINWHDLMAADPDAAWEFYSELFGWDRTGSMEMGTYTYQMFGHDETSYGGIAKKPDEAPSASWLYYIHVDDLDAALASVESRGGQITHGPLEIPGGSRVAHCVDPEGAVFALHGA
jgi:hypothetical protein